MLCHLCGEREADVFQSQRVGNEMHQRAICSPCARRDYGIFLGALLQSQAPGAPPLTQSQERELRRVLDEAAPPEQS